MLALLASRRSKVGSTEFRPTSEVSATIGA
jgi:hypothetical protein